MNSTLSGNYSDCALGDTLKSYTFIICDSLNAQEEMQWNKLVPETNRLMNYDQLSTIAACQGGDMQFKYVFISKDDSVVGIAYFQVVHFWGSDLVNYFPDEPAAGFKKQLYRLVKAISFPLIRSINLKLLVSGNVFMTGENGFYFNHDVAKEDRARLLRKAIKEITKTDKQIKAALISDLYEPKSEFDIAFKANGYHEITVEADMSIKLKEEWNTFADYLNALSSKYRVRAKKTFALCKENEVQGKDLTEAEIGEYEGQLLELYEEVMGRAEFKLATLHKDFFGLQKKNLPDNYGIRAYFKQEKLIGFISYYHFGKKMEVHYAGMNKEVSKPIQLYQHMLYDMVEFGINHKFERLHFGRTAPEIKSTIGATPSPMYGYVKHFNPVFNFLMVRNYTANLKPKEYIIRNPFK